MHDLLKFSMPGKPEYIKSAKLAVQTAAGVADFTLEQIEDIGIALGEACKLITCHGHDGWSDFYEIECLIDSDKISLEIKDEHCMHKIEKGKRPCMDCPNEGNLGLYVIRTLMDDVEVVKNEGKKNSIKMVKHKNDKSGIV